MKKSKRVINSRLYASDFATLSKVCLDLINLKDSLDEAGLVDASYFVNIALQGLMKDLSKACYVRNAKKTFLATTLLEVTNDNSSSCL